MSIAGRRRRRSRRRWTDRSRPAQNCDGAEGPRTRQPKPPPKTKGFGFGAGGDCAHLDVSGLAEVEGRGGGRLHRVQRASLLLRREGRAAGALRHTVPRRRARGARCARRAHGGAGCARIGTARAVAGDHRREPHPFSRPGHARCPRARRVWPKAGKGRVHTLGAFRIDPLRPPLKGLSLNRLLQAKS